MKILIVDDHPLIRLGLKRTLAAEKDISVAGECGTAAEALAMLDAAQFDVLVLDINLPDGNGLNVLRTIRKSDSGLPVLVLSIHPEDCVAMHAIKAGANGYLCKDSAPEALVQAVRQVGAGGSYVSPRLADMMVQELSGRSAVLPHESLTDREYQIMCLLAAGKSISAIATALSRSPTTISTHRSRVLDKMRMSSNTELARYAATHRLID